MLREIGYLFRSVLPTRAQRIILKNAVGMNSPYTRYDDEHQCIFIHIPKTAGISVSVALFNANIGHRRIEYFEIFDQDRFERYFKFAFVRNPWARALSAYSFLKQGGRNSSDKAWAERHLSEFSTFRQFVLSLQQPRQRSRVLRWQHFTPQHRYICGSKLDIKVDFVGRVERLPQDFDYVKRRVGIEADLSHLNRSDHTEYQSYYTRKTRAIIADVYRPDIELLGYRFFE
jgi:hypothetical protein